MRIDGLESNLDTKKSVRVVTTAAITLSGLQTIDGISLVAGDRVLVKDQADATTNGIYVVASGSWARSFDAKDNRGVSAGMTVTVDDGVNNADTQWALTTKEPVLGVTNLAFVKTVDAEELQKLADFWGDYTDGVGIIARADDGSLNHIEIDGTANQISIDNGNGADNISVSLPEDLILPGTRGVTIPSGDAASRVVSPAGTVRYNTDRGGLEVNTPAGWAKVATLTDKAIKNSTIRVVNTDPGEGQYASINDAMASISDSGEDNQFLILVLPGSYYEDEIQVKPFVMVVGSNEYAVHIYPNSATQHLFVMGTGANLVNLSIHNTGPGYAGVVVWNNADSILLHKVGTYDCDIGIWHKADTHNSTLYLEYSDCTGGNTTFKGESSNGFSAYANLENFYSYSNDANENPEFGVFLTGINTSMNVQAFGMEGAGNTECAFHIQDGAHCDLKAGSIFGWERAVHIANTGEASVSNMVGVDMHDNTYDILVEHPAADGSFNGAADRAKVSIVDSSSFTVAYNDPVNNGFVITGDLYVGPHHSDIANVTSLITRGIQLGLMDGGVLTRGTGLNVNVGAGSGYLMNGNNDLVNVDWPATSVAVADNKNQYVYITINGVAMVSESIPDTGSNIVLGRMLTSGGSILFIGSSGSLRISTFNPNLDKLLRNAVGALYVSGSVVSENATSPRHLDITSGHYFYSASEMFPVGATDVTMLIGHNTSGVPAYSFSKVIDNANYDNGTNLTAIPAGKFTAHVLFTIGSGATTGYALSYGRAVYDTLADAIVAPVSPPIIPPEGSPLIAKIIVQEGATNIAQILDLRPRFGVSGQSTAATTKHGDLLGLNADDHPQYMLASGTRALTGQLDVGSNAIVNAGLINGVNVAAHASRHQPNGSDPLPTGPGISVSGSSTNSTGISNNLSRADHGHALGADVWTNSNHPTTISGYGIGDLTSSVRTSISVSGSLSYNASTGVLSYTTPTTDGVSEGGGNQYFTSDRARAAISTTGSLSYNNTTGVISYTTPNSDGIVEGSTNQYFTAARARLSISVTGNLAYNSATGVLSYTNPTTSSVTEGTNLYFTNARARLALAAGGSLSYDNSTGIISYTTPTTSGIVEGTNLYFTQARARGAISTSGSLGYDSNTGVISYTTPTTSGITEGSNQYFTQARARTSISATGSLAYNNTTGVLTYTTPTTDGITEGSTNLYFTTARARGAVSATGSLSYSSSTGVISYTTPTSDGITEGSTNLYFTTARARGAVSVTGSLAYNSGTGVISYTTPTTDGITEGTTNFFYTGARARAAISVSAPLTYNASTGLIGYVSPAITGDVSIPSGGTTATLANSGVTAGSFTSVNVNAKGLVTGGTNVQSGMGQVFAGSFAQQTNTTAIPYDATVPLATEGTLLGSASVTPQSAASKFTIEMAGMIDSGTAARSVTIAVFRGTTFIGATSSYFPNASQQRPFTLKIVDVPNTTSAVVYSMRIGTSSSGSAWYLGRGTTATLGGANPTAWIITELV